MEKFALNFFAFVSLYPFLLPAADVVVKVKVEVTEEEFKNHIMYAGVGLAAIIPIIVAASV